MLGRLVLILLQLGVGYFLGKQLVPYLPAALKSGNLNLFAFAIAFALMVWVIGLVGAEVLKEVGRPSSAALVSALVVACILAAIVIFVPQVKQFAGRIDSVYFPLIGAVLGYHFRR